MTQEKIDQLKVLILRAVCAGIDYGAAKDDQLNTRLAALHAAEAEVEAKLRELTLNPLSAQQIRDAWYECGIGIAYDIPLDQDNYDWARAIERAHGIGEPPCEQPS